MPKTATFPAAAGQLGVDLGHAAVFGVAEAADRGDDVEAELVLREGESPLLLGSEAGPTPGTGGVTTVADLEPEPDQALQGGEGPRRDVGGPERPAAGGAGPRLADQIQGPIGKRAGTPSRHEVTPRSLAGSRSNNLMDLDQ